LRTGRVMTAWCQRQPGVGNREITLAGVGGAQSCYGIRSRGTLTVTSPGDAPPSPYPADDPMATSTRRRPWYSILYIQVLIAIALGIALGYFKPDLGKEMKPLGDGFISLIKMMIAPVIFCTVVHGISSMGDLRKVGRVGVKTLLYFETVSTFALVIGLLVGEIVRPGAGFNIDPASLDPKAVATYVTRAKEEGIVAHLLAIIPPDSFLGALARGDLLQVLLVSILSGFAIAQLGELGQRIAGTIDTAAKMFFGVIRIIVRAAPVGAFGAMAFTIGSQGLAALWNLGALILVFYLTSIIFVIVVLGAIAHFAGFSIFRFIGYIKDELLIVVGTSSSETVLPQLMRKMEHLGASKSVVGLVVPTGYSFNLDGTNIYMTLAILFLAQATNTPLTFGQLLGILAIAMITSKGASGVTGAGFVTLAATLSIIPDIPITSLALLLGIDKFMSECRALTNLVGNGVACVVISRWEHELDADALHETMAHPLIIGEEMETVPA
jgi:aerobic C4-dicarboxylate transport protein